MPMEIPRITTLRVFSSGNAKVWYGAFIFSRSPVRPLKSWMLKGWIRIPSAELFALGKRIDFSLILDETQDDGGNCALGMGRRGLNPIGGRVVRLLDVGPVDCSRGVVESDGRGHVAWISAQDPGRTGGKRQGGREGGGHQRHRRGKDWRYGFALAVSRRGSTGGWGFWVSSCQQKGRRLGCRRLRAWIGGGSGLFSQNLCGCRIRGGVFVAAEDVEAIRR
ncbi:hypothetical protein Zmor_020290 [Zophobas morio]|uniref:Uncharacterized protein n=1 Tax=Zophobas morio TaxID=2755281 RepID=A0AA38I5C2_9CUCU|nr:hypothetical protein Zmor_020290 [Zophobas morio]